MQAAHPAIVQGRINVAYDNEIAVALIFSLRMATLGTGLKNSAEWYAGSSVQNVHITGDMHMRTFCTSVSFAG